MPSDPFDSGGSAALMELRREMHGIIDLCEALDKRTTALETTEGSAKEIIEERFVSVRGALLSDNEKKHGELSRSIGEKLDGLDTKIESAIRKWMDENAKKLMRAEIFERERELKTLAESEAENERLRKRQKRSELLGLAGLVSSIVTIIAFIGAMLGWWSIDDANMVTDVMP